MEDIPKLVHTALQLYTTWQSILLIHDLCYKSGVFVNVSHFVCTTYADVMLFW